MRHRKQMLLVLAVLIAVLPSAAEQQSPPRGGQPKDFNLPEKQRFTLDNGLSATLVPYGTLPKVTTFLVEAGRIVHTQ